MSGPNSESRSHFPGMLHVRCPAVLPEVIEATAQRQLMTPSEYIRRSVFDRLKADGADLASLAGAACRLAYPVSK